MCNFCKCYRVTRTGVASLSCYQKEQKKEENQNKTRMDFKYSLRCSYLLLFSTFNAF